MMMPTTHCRHEISVTRRTHKKKANVQKKERKKMFVFYSQQDAKPRQEVCIYASFTRFLQGPISPFSSVLRSHSIEPLILVPSVAHTHTPPPWFQPPSHERTPLFTAATFHHHVVVLLVNNAIAFIYKQHAERGESMGHATRGWDAPSFVH